MHPFRDCSSLRATIGKHKHPIVDFFRSELIGLSSAEICHRPEVDIVGVTVRTNQINESASCQVPDDYVALL